MSDARIAYSAAHHPAPHRERVGLGAILYGLFAAPIIWAGNQFVTYGLASHACYPHAVPLPQPVAGFGFVWPLMLACYIVALALCASGAWVARRTWRLSGTEVEGHAHHLLEKGEGRTRFLAVIGISFSLLFFCAVLFGVVVLAIEPLCVH